MPTQTARRPGVFARTRHRTPAMHIMLRFDIGGENVAEDVSGYWANPRLVADESE